MDPITIIGLLASLANLADAGNSVIKVIKTFKNGDKDLSDLASNISTFTEALKGFDRILRSRQTIHRISPSVIKDLLDDGNETLTDLQSKLQQMSSLEVSTMRRLKWVQLKPTIKRLHERLKEQNTMLQTFLTLAHADTFLAVVSQHPQFELICSPAEEEMTIEYRQEQSFVPLQVPQLEYGRSTSSVRRLSSSSSVRTIESTMSSLEALSVVSSATSIASSFRRLSYDTCNPNRTSNIDLDQSVSTQISLQQELVIRKSCRYNCYCKCHEQNVSRTSKSISKSKGPKFQCSETTCGVAVAAEKKRTAQSMSFRKALLQVMSSKSIKVRYDLSTYRMVSEGSEAMRHVKHGNLEKLKQCVTSGDATLWDTAPDGWSLLHTAAYNRQLPIVKYLLEMGADTETGDVGSRKPGDLALLKSLGQDVTKVEHDIIEVFSEKDDYMSDFEFTPIHIAVLDIYNVTDNERPTLEALIRVLDDANNAPAGTNWEKLKVRFRDRSPLFGAIIEYFRASAFEVPKTRKIIHNLIDQKDKKNCWTPLHWAASAGRVDKMKILMEHGADPFLLSNLDANIIHAAAESKGGHGLVGALEIWKRYPTQLNINQKNRWAETPLHVAAWTSAACVKLLVEAGANPNVKQEDEQVPLHCAGLSERGRDRREIVSLLCSAETREHINIQDRDGRPPIFDFLDDPDCIKILVDSGARWDLCDNSGKSIFHHASKQDESDVLKILLPLAAESRIVAAKDHAGNTPLIDALCHDSIECALLLLELEDVGDVIGKDGWAAVHYAAKIGDVDLLEATLNHPSFIKGMKTIDGKTIDTVAMEAGNWFGEVKYLVRKYNSRG